MQKSVHFKLIAFVFISTFLASCSMQKRVYNRGFHIEWREANRKVVEGESIKAKKASKVQYQNSGALTLQSINEEKDSCNTSVVHSAFAKQQLPAPTFYHTSSQQGKRDVLRQAMTGPGSVFKHYKKADTNYSEYPDGNVSSGLGGFLTSLVAILLLFTNAIGWGLLMLLIGLILCIIGIIQQIDEPDTADLIFAVLGLCIIGVTTYLFMPIIGPIVLFFIANPGVLLLLLLIFGIYLLMSA